MAALREGKKVLCISMLKMVSLSLGYKLILTFERSLKFLPFPAEFNVQFQSSYSLLLALKNSPHTHQPTEPHIEANKEASKKQATTLMLPSKYSSLGELLILSFHPLVLNVLFSAKSIGCDH